MKDRIKQIQDSTGMTQSDFAHHIGLSPAALSSLYGGRTNPTLKTVECIQSKFPDINLIWLINGEGDMFLNNKSISPEQPQEQEPSLSFEDSPKTPQNTPQKLPKSMAIQTSVKNTPINQVKNEVKNPDKPKRSITEIRVYFDDLTYETFVPKKL